MRIHYHGVLRVVTLEIEQAGANELVVALLTYHLQRLALQILVPIIR